MDNSHCVRHAAGAYLVCTVFTGKVENAEGDRAGVRRGIIGYHCSITRIYDYGSVVTG